MTSNDKSEFYEEILTTHQRYTNLEAILVYPKLPSRFKVRYRQLHFVPPANANFLDRSDLCEIVWNWMARVEDLIEDIQDWLLINM